MNTRRVTQIRFRFEGLRNYRPDVIELRMQGVVELRDVALSRRLDLFRILVTSRAERLIRQQVVIRFHALQRR